MLYLFYSNPNFYYHNSNNYYSSYSILYISLFIYFQLKLDLKIHYSFLVIFKKECHKMVKFGCSPAELLSGSAFVDPYSTYSGM